MKLYGGLKDHPRQEEIDKHIIEKKMSSIGYRKIAESLLTKFKLKVSHTLISKYYKDCLGGAVLDMAKEKAEQALIESLPEPVEENINRTPSIDIDRLNELTDKYKDIDGEIGGIYAYALALCEGNIKAHIEGVDRLRIEYVKYLRDVRAVYGSKIKVW